MVFEVQLVNSTAIRLIGFCDGTLRVIFRSGAAYDYFDVSREVFEQLATAESVGTQFQAVRNTHRFQKLEAQATQQFLLAVLEANTDSRLMVEAA